MTIKRIFKGYYTVELNGQQGEIFYRPATKEWYAVKAGNPEHYIRSVSYKRAKSNIKSILKVA